MDLSMANRKSLFFAEVAKTLGATDLARLFRDTAAQARSERDGDAAAVAGQWICKVCSMIDDPVVGDPDSGIAAGTPFEAIPDTWRCPICGTRKANFIPYCEPELKAA
jgi:rubredoxin